MSLDWLTPDRRKAIYAILTALVPLLVSYGALDQEQAALWLALGASVFGTGMATFFTGRPYGKHAADDE